MVGGSHRIGLALVLVLTCAAVLASGAPGLAQAPAQQPAPPATPAPLPPPLDRDGVVAPGGDALGGLLKPGDEVRLSNETTVTRWAYAHRRSVVRVQPSAGARAITRLRFVSGSRAGEIYGVLSGRVNAAGGTWLRVRIPGRPNGRTGWAPASAFEKLTLMRTQLIVNRSTLRATLYRAGRRIWRAPVGVGKRSTPTPGGHFFVDRKEGPIYGPVYGAHVLFTTAFANLDWPGGGAVGMHGTNEPGLVPGRPSHGCIRMHNRDVKRLARLLPVGTPLLIR